MSKSDFLSRALGQIEAPAVYKGASIIDANLNRAACLRVGHLHRGANRQSARRCRKTVRIVTLTIGCRVTSGTAALIRSFDRCRWRAPGFRDRSQAARLRNGSQRWRRSGRWWLRLGLRYRLSGTCCQKHCKAEGKAALNNRRLNRRPASNALGDSLLTHPIMNEILDSSLKTNSTSLSTPSPYVYHWSNRRESKKDCSHVVPYPLPISQRYPFSLQFRTNGLANRGDGYHSGNTMALAHMPNLSRRVVQAPIHIHICLRLLCSLPFPQLR